MSKAYDALMRELEDETSSPENTTPAETTPAEEPKPEETPAEPPKEEPNPPEEPKPAEPNPSEEPKPSEEPPAPQRKPSEFSPEERAAHAFSRQLAKEREKHARELAEMKESFQKQLDELKSASKPKEPLKTRADFENDDAYIKYLANQQVNEIMAERDKKASEDAAEQAKQQAEQAEQDRILQSEQAAWLSNVDSAYGEDVKGKQAFLSRLQTCLDKGLGAVLDACPVASEFLLRSAGGPKVLDHLINDRAAFERVFNDRSTPLDQYFELRQIENELKGQPSATPAPQPNPAPTQTPAPAPQNFPRLGHPGKGGNATEPSIFDDPAEMRAFLRSGH